MVPLRQSTAKDQQKWNAKCKTRLTFACFCVFLFAFSHTHTTSPQVPRNKSKKGGVQRRVYFWAGISWFCKTPGVVWTAADIQVTYRYTKNLCFGTVFQDEDDNGQPCVFRVVETRAAGNDDYVSYVRHFDFPDDTPEDQTHIFCSKYREVKE